MSIKIRFVTPWYGEFAGGAEYAARKLAENLFKINIDVGVLTTCCKTPFDDWWSDDFIPGEYKINGIKVLRFPVNKEHSDLYHKVNNKIINGLPLSREEELNYMRGNINSHALISYIKKNRQYLYVFIPYLYGTTFWGTLSVPERAIIIPCLHDEPVARWEIIRNMFIRARKIILLTNEEKELAKRFCNLDTDSMTVLGVGLDTVKNYNALRFREKYKIKEPFIIYAGRKDMGKNVHTMIDYFKRYVELYDNKLKMVFIGGGDPSIIPQNDSRFIDLSIIPEQDKYDAISASIALCNLSENESFSFVIMESWLTSRPVIVSSKCNVTRAHCIKSKGGISVSNVQEFIECVKKLSKETKYSDEMGANGKKYVEENYSWDKIIQKYLKVFEDIK